MIVCASVLFFVFVKISMNSVTDDEQARSHGCSRSVGDRVAGREASRLACVCLYVCDCVHMSAREARRPPRAAPHN